MFLFRPRKLTAEDADRPEQLVPIRLEFDVEHHKMRDSFVWNLNGKRLEPCFLSSTIPMILYRPCSHSRGFCSIGGRGLRSCSKLSQCHHQVDSGSTERLQDSFGKSGRRY